MKHQACYRKKKKLPYTFALLWLFLPIQAGTQTFQSSPQLGQQLTETHCTLCHNLDYITMQPRLTREQTQSLWKKTVKKMVESYGAEIADQVIKKTIIDYLISQSKIISRSPYTFAGEGADISHTQTNFAPR